MYSFLTHGEQSDKNEQLKALLHRMESTNDAQQYFIGLKCASLAFSLGEHSEALSYLLQAELLQSSYEVQMALFYLYASGENWEEAQTYLEKLSDRCPQQLDVFSWEELDSWLTKPLPPFLALSLDKLRNQKTNHPPRSSFQEILREDPLHAAKIFHQWKKESGLSDKYPHINNLSIEDWEKAYPHRKEKIREKEHLQEQNIVLDFEELIELGKMYLLENEFQKAATCFTNARDLHFSR